MKISILTPNMSSNALGRAYLLGQLLSPENEVEIVGPVLGGDIWPPLRDTNDNITLVPIKTRTLFSYVKYLAENMSSDVIYVSKPLLTSFGIWEIVKSRNNVPVVIDIDDWDLAFVVDSIKKGYLPWYQFPGPHNYFKALPDSYVLDKIAETINVPKTVSNSFLKRKFGGTIIWHTRDEEKFNPKKYPPETAKEKLGLPTDKTVVMFFGTPRPHKGVKELILSFREGKLAERNDPMLVIAGIGRDVYSQRILTLARKILANRVKFIGYIPFSKIPEVVSAADIYVIPQIESKSARGQLPAKLFDAMAMSKAIISTNVSDIPEILNNAGIIIPSDQRHMASELSKALVYLLDNPKLITSLGLKARKKFLRNYSFSRMRASLRTVLKNALGDS
ncbi:glycosyltransferase [Thermococcus sp. 21S7]|uniref:glycosyltransferase n=1 Tax=Thermococcus sp. 21S7 TaxID=1638221 RepID=UPI00143995CB|nr:glycosyltransferase [Thermococcus sp. 21S7]NJE61791.1 glycosyltransferase [Thermococcus sp. 21S7]